MKRSLHNDSNAMLRFVMSILKIRHVQQAVLNQRQQLQRLRHQQLQQQQTTSLQTPIHIGFVKFTKRGRLNVWWLRRAILIIMLMIGSIMMKPILTIIMKITNVTTQFRLYAILILKTKKAMAVIIGDPLGTVTPWTIPIFCITVHLLPTAS